MPDKKYYPELREKINTEMIVVGGGIVGLTLAWNLAEAGVDCVLLEKNHIATGDSGLTTGFLTCVPDTSVTELRAKYGMPFVKDLFTAAKETQLRIFNFITSRGIECDFNYTVSNYLSSTPNDEVLKTEWPSYQEADAQTERLPSVIKFIHEGSIHPRKYLFGLANILEKKRARIFEETEALNISTGPQVSVRTPHGEVTANAIIIAVGDPSALFPELGTLIEPYLTYVVAARYDKNTLSNDLFWDTSDPYFYYRKIDDKTVILGGCDRPASSAALGDPFSTLDSFLKKNIPGKYEIICQWSGSIFHTEDGLPYADAHPHYEDKVFFATGFGGNGLVMGSFAAKILSDLVLKKATKTAELFSLKRTGVKIAPPTITTSAFSASSTSPFVPFSPLRDFDSGKPVCKTIQGRAIVVFKIDDTFYAIDNNCSHAGGPLCDGTRDGFTIQCPFHGAQFDIKTGEVKGPPAVRPQNVYVTRINGEVLEIEIFSTRPGRSEDPKGATFVASVSLQPRENRLKKLLLFGVGALAFWFLQFAVQYFWLSKDDIGSSLVRSFALAGATLVSLALFSSAIFKFKPRLAVYWRFRRYLGVSGFIFIFFHVLSVTHFIFDYNLSAIYFSYNPLKNPIIFGSFAFPILFVMAATSTDWAVNKLTPRVWKFIHRFVYIAYISSIFHFLLVNPLIIKNPPGYVLLAVTALALLGQLYWYIRISIQKRFLSVGSLIGIIFILAVAVTAYFSYAIG